MTSSRICPSSILWISIHIPRGGDDNLSIKDTQDYHISIHIPRGGDDMRQLAVDSDGRISIHIPRGGDDVNGKTTAYKTLNFNPHPPWGG